MPFIPTPIVGALTAINATRKNQENAKNVSSNDELLEKRPKRSAFKEIFFGPGK